MLLPEGNRRVWLCTEPTDMRKSFNGLSALVKHRLSEDPLSGHFFVFINRRGDRLKLLGWDGQGFWIWYQLLESGRFELPASSDGEQIEACRLRVEDNDLPVSWSFSGERCRSL